MEAFPNWTVLHKSMKFTYVNSAYIIIIAITSRSLFSITISVQVLPIKKKWNQIKNQIKFNLKRK